MSVGEFLWINEDSFSSTSLKWASGSPDDGDSNEDCVEFNEYQELNDETCTDGLYYICENDLCKLIFLFWGLMNKDKLPRSWA